MKKFLKVNWFNLSLLTLLTILIVGLFYYLFFFNKPHPQVTQEARVEHFIPITTPTVATTETVKPKAEMKEKPVVKVNPNLASIKSQIIFFEDALESKILDLDINCKTLSAYNYYSKIEASDMATMFPESQDSYINKCRGAYVAINFLEGKLIAEPELTKLRKLLSEFIDLGQSVALDALSGGSTGATSDLYSTKSKELLRDSREEVLRVQRLYGVVPNYN